MAGREESGEPAKMREELWEQLLAAVSRGVLDSVEVDRIAAACEADQERAQRVIDCLRTGLSELGKRGRVA